MSERHDPRARPPADEHASDDVWEAYARAELSREDEAVLRALAESDADHDDRALLHAPLDEAFRARVTDVLASQLEAERRRRFRVRTAAVSTVLAAAAAVLLVFLPGERGALPEYAVALSGSVAETRGASDAASNVFVPSSRLTIALTPASAVQQQLEVRAFLARDGREMPWDVPVERAPSGAVRIQGRASDLLGDRYGTYQARIELHVPGDAEAAKSLTVLFRYQPTSP